MIDDQLSAAVIAYVDKVGHLDSEGRQKRVVAVPGDGAYDLLPQIAALQGDLYSAVQPRWDVEDLAGVVERADRWLRDLHPELSVEPRDALRTQFAFDWK